MPHMRHCMPRRPEVRTGLNAERLNTGHTAWENFFIKKIAITYNCLKVPKNYINQNVSDLT